MCGKTTERKSQKVIQVHDSIKTPQKYINIRNRLRSLDDAITQSITGKPKSSSKKSSEKKVIRERSRNQRERSKLELF